MAKLMRNMLLLVKTETTEGVDAAPTAGANAILARGIAPVPVNADFAERNLIQPYFGHTGSVQTQKYATIEFEVELASSGVAGTAPKWGPLLLSCGFAETITAGTKVDYSPITSGQKTSTIHCYLDGIKHAMVGAKGNVSFGLSAGGIPVMKFNYIGLCVDPVDASNPTGADFTGFKPPLAVNKSNTPTLTLHGVAVKAKELSVDMANQVDYRNYIGAETVSFTERKPAGSIMFEYDDISVKDWYAAVASGALNSFSLVHGSTAGHIIQLAAPKVQVTSPQISDDNGYAMLTLAMALQPNLGNDDFIVTSR